MTFPVQSNPIAIAIALILGGCLESEEDPIESAPPSPESPSAHGNPDRCASLERDAQGKRVQFINRGGVGYFQHLGGASYAYQLNCRNLDHFTSEQSVDVRTPNSNLPVEVYTDVLRNVRGVDIGYDRNACMDVEGKMFCKATDFFSDHISPSVLSFDIRNLHELNGQMFIFRGEGSVNGCFLASSLTFLRMDIVGECR